MGFGAVVLEVAGGALADISWHAPFYIYLIALLIIPGAFISIKDLKKDSPQGQNKHKHVEIQGKQKQLPLKSIALIYVATFTLMVLFFSVPTKLPFVLDEKGITSALIIGALISIPGLFGTVGALAQVKVSGFVTEMKTNLFFFIMMGVGVFILSIAPDIPTLIVGLIITGIAFGIINTTNLGWLGRIAPEDSRGKIFSGFTTVLFLGQLASPLVIQPILKTGTLYDAYAFLGIAGVALGLVFGIVNGMGVIEQTPVVSGHPVGIEAEE
jgi:predicted MFS family arabinose efflux permease